jgi:hypothetical protein
LRQKAYSASGKSQEATDNLRAIVDHRGAVYLSGVSIYSQAVRDLDHPLARTELVSATR